jgi:hypothetical protein
VHLSANGEGAQAFLPGNPSSRPSTHRLSLAPLPCRVAG